MHDELKFSPNPFLKNSHLQTFWPRIFGVKYKNTFIPERLELSDGDFVDLCWTDKPVDKNKPIVFVFHGLEGSINSPYALGIMNAIRANGWLGVLMHFRSCSEEHNRLDRNYHSGDTGDIGFLINTIKQRHAQSPLFAIAYSLGANAMLKYLGEQGNDCPLKAAIAVSVPFQLNRGADRLNQGFSKFYQWYLIKSLREKMKDKYQGRNAPIDLSRLDEYRNFWLFDNNITAPLHGFQSAEEYYRLSSCKQYLNKIETRTLILHAKDDPFIPLDAIPVETELSDSVLLELSEHGGHVGFVSGSNPFRPEYWLEKRVPEYIKEFL